MTEKHAEHHAERHAERYAERSTPRYVKLAKHPAWMLATLILVVLVAALFLTRPQVQAPAAGPDQGNVSQNVSQSNLAARVQAYLNENLLQQQGLQAEVVSVEEYGNDLQMINVAIKNGTATLQTAPLLATKSGDFLILSPQFALNTSQKIELPSEATPTPQAIPKLAKPETKFFVMSFCPYGQEAEKMLKPVAELFKDKVVFEPHFVIYDKSLYAGQESTYCMEDACSMHGLSELKEDMRQACIWKNDKSKWWDYVYYVDTNCSLSNIEECWKTAADRAGVNETMVESCVANEGVALMQAEKNANKEFGVQGSETIFLNDVRVSPAQYRFEPDKMKTLVCSAFTTPPAECSISLATTGTGSAPSGSCG